MIKKILVFMVFHYDAKKIIQPAKKLTKSIGKHSNRNDQLLPEIIVNLNWKWADLKISLDMRLRRWIKSSKVCYYATLKAIRHMNITISGYKVCLMLFSNTHYFSDIFYKEYEQSYYHYDSLFLLYIFVHTLYNKAMCVRVIYI